MTSTSIRNMNWTTGRKELETGYTHPLTLVRNTVKVAYDLQGRHDEDTRRVGNNLEATALHSLVIFLYTDPDHILNAEQDITDTLNADPRTLAQYDLDQWQDEWTDTYQDLGGM